MTSARSAFAGRRAVIATMHGKEKVIGPVFRDKLGLVVEAIPDLDTDQFGTFTGEIERSGSMEDALRAKARLGFSRSRARIAIASEGSYGPHSSCGFLAVGIEKMILVDEDSGLVAMEQLIDSQPCFDQLEFTAGEPLKGFLERVGFPEQGVIVRPVHAAPNVVHKGIQSNEALAEAIASCASAGTERLRIETDMRAHMNPRRRRMIGELAERFAERLLSHCPACNAPGWGVVSVEKGLPCRDCGDPSLLTLNEVRGCFQCAYRSSQPRLDGLRVADPAHCPACNP